MRVQQVAIEYARTKIGDPYVYGASGPNAFDCSGLTKCAYEAAGVWLPRTTYGQVLVGFSIDPHDTTKWHPGDLIFPTPSHVQLWVGQDTVNGQLVEDQIIEAPATGLDVRECLSWAALPVYAVKRFGAKFPGTLQLGSQGQAVKDWQRHIGTKVTGTYDQTTALATQNYQETLNVYGAGLVVDGIAGPRTWALAFGDV